MTRQWFGGDQIAVIEADAVDGVDDLAQMSGSQPVTAWNMQTGGTQYTDLLDASDAPITQSTTSTGADGYSLGTILPFQGPDDVWELWGSVNGAPRFRMSATNTGARLGPEVDALTTSFDAHVAATNPHDTGVGDLSDVQVDPPDDRVTGRVLAWSAPDAAFTLQTPATVAGGVMLDPPLVGASYVGNVAEPPPTGQNEPWLQMAQPYSAGDNNPDALQLFSTHSDGTTPIKTFWTNGNNEARSAPSTRNRIAARVFEAYENLGGASTSRFFELSTNPTITANREPLLGAYGTSHSTQPGWIVATRVLAGLLGVRAGGSYNSLTAVNFRGQLATAAAPTTGTWIAGDVVIGTTGQVFMCTVSGTPGTWVGGAAAAPTAYVAITPGASMGHGSKSAATRLDRGGDNARLRGFLTASGSVSSGNVVATIPTTAHRPLAPVTTIARYTGGGTQTIIATSGEITLGNSLTAGQSVWLDSITWDLLA